MVRVEERLECAPVDRYRPLPAGGRLPEVFLVLGGLAVLTDLCIQGFTGAGDTVYLAVLAIGYSAAWVIRVLRPQLPISALFAVVAALDVVTDLTESLLMWQLDDAAPDPVVVAWLDLAGDQAGALSVVLTVYGLALFPEGYFDASWQQPLLRLSWVALPVPLLVTTSSPVIPLAPHLDAAPLANPFHVLPLTMSPDLGAAVTGLAFSMFLLGPGVLLVRYRHADSETRRRIRWLLVPLALLVLLVLGNLVPSPATAQATWLAMLVGGVSSSVVTVLAVVAPARVDADWALRKTFVFGSLWLAIAGAYVAVAATVGVAAGRALPLGWALGVALVAAVLFQPLRTRLEALANRWIFGGRPDHTHVIGELGVVLSQTYDLATLLPRMSATLEKGLALEWARVEVSGVEPSGAPVVEPVVLDGVVVGHVACGPKLAGSWTDADRDVVGTFARHAALAVKNVRLTQDLAGHVEELAASQSRLVRAQEQERRRIERNIHDGVQQELVALMGQVGLAQRRIRRSAQVSPASVASELGDLRAGLQRLLDDLRQLAAGVHPSLLTDRGLPDAVEALVRRYPVRVALDIGPEVRASRLPEEVEGAAYFTVAEALANSLKYSDAGQVTVGMAQPNGSLVVRVADDGVGFDTTAQAGQGLRNLAARANALGGQVEVESRPGAGTTVRATFAVGKGAG